MKKAVQIILIVLLALAILLAVGFSYLYSHGLSGLQANTQPQPGQIKVACVGDSITYGHGVRNWEENNYPAVLQRLLGEGYHVANFGSSGACVNPMGDQPYTGRAVYTDSLAYEADILIFMLGSNDAKPENWTDAETFRSQFEALLGTYLTGEKIPTVYIGLCAKGFYLDGATSGPAGYDIQPAVVDEIVETLRGITTVSGCPVEILDIHALTGAHPEWFAADGIHPDQAGAESIARHIADALQ